MGEAHDAQDHEALGRAACLVGDDIGPQDTAGLLFADAEPITPLATIKREADEVEDDGVIGISAMGPER